MEPQVTIEPPANDTIPQFSTEIGEISEPFKPKKKKKKKLVAPVIEDDDFNFEDLEIMDINDN